jgi:hypothetical protein
MRNLQCALALALMIVGVLVRTVTLAPAHDTSAPIAARPPGRGRGDFGDLGLGQSPRLTRGRQLPSTTRTPLRP